MKDTNQNIGVDSILGDLSDPSEQSSGNVERILHAVRSHLGMDVAFVSEFVGGRRIFRHIDAAGRTAPMQVGGSDPLEESYCHHIVGGRLPELIPDTAAVPLAMAMPATTSLPVGAHLSVPIRLQDGRIYGTFCCFSFAPDHSLNERDLRMMRAFADLAGQQIDRDLSSGRAHEEKTLRIKDVLEKDQLSILYQPIYRLKDSRVAAFECLARISAEPVRPPDLWFKEATEVGLSLQLELAAVRKALAGLSFLRSNISLAVNVSPATLLSEEFAAVLEGMPAKRIVLEVTEHASVENYADLSCAIEPLRQRGLRIAIDDAGAGYASFRHILNLRPDLIKIDMSLTRRIDSDPARQALTSALIRFARKTASQIVAEGVETAGELEVLRTLGVTKAQGYLMGRPVPLASAVQLCSEPQPKLTDTLLLPGVTDSYSKAFGQTETPSPAHRRIR